MLINGSIRKGNEIAINIIMSKKNCVSKVCPSKMNHIYQNSQFLLMELTNKYVSQTLQEIVLCTNI